MRKARLNREAGGGVAKASAKGGGGGWRCGAAELRERLMRDLHRVIDECCERVCVGVRSTSVRRLG